MLLLNDRFDQQWSVTVDGQPATLLRCNYLMRGVQLTPGSHTVRFNFHIPIGLPSYVTFAAYGIGLALLAALAFSRTASRRISARGRRISASGGSKQGRSDVSG